MRNLTNFLSFSDEVDLNKEYLEICEMARVCVQFMSKISFVERVFTYIGFYSYV